MRERRWQASIMRYLLALRGGDGRLIIGTLTRHSLDFDYSDSDIYQRMMSQFGYIPLMRLPLFSLLRLFAYQEGTALINPTIDFQGWHSNRPAQIVGTLFKDRGFELPLFCARA